MSFGDPTLQPLRERLLLIEQKLGHLTEFCERINGRITIIWDAIVEIEHELEEIHPLGYNGE